MLGVGCKHGQVLASTHARGNEIGTEVREIDTTVKIKMESDELEMAIEKANRLVELLREAQQIISSLSEKEESEA